MRAEASSPNDDVVTFGDYTSAFLGAVQSSYLILHGKHSPYRKRVRQWRRRLPPEVCVFLAFMADLRNSDVHALEFQRVRTATLALGLSVAIANAPPPQPKPIPAPTLGPWRSRQPLAGRQLDVIPACERFLTLGQQVVEVLEPDAAES
jgi:hypothetical protein